MHPGRFWGVVFALVTIGFIADTYFVVKGMRRKRLSLLDILISLMLPLLILFMLRNEQLTVGEKIIDSIIAFVCVVSGIVHIYVLRKKSPPDKEKRP